MRRQDPGPNHGCRREGRAEGRGTDGRGKRQGVAFPGKEDGHGVVDGRDEDVIEALHDKGTTQDALIDSLKARIAAVKGASI